MIYRVRLQYEELCYLRCDLALKQLKAISQTYNNTLVDSKLDTIEVLLSNAYRRYAVHVGVNNHHFVYYFLHVTSVEQQFFLHSEVLVVNHTNVITEIFYYYNIIIINI